MHWQQNGMRHDVDGEKLRSARPAHSCRIVSEWQVFMAEGRAVVEFCCCQNCSKHALSSDIVHIWYIVRICGQPYICRTIKCMHVLHHVTGICALRDRFSSLQSQGAKQQH